MNKFNFLLICLVILSLGSCTIEKRTFRPGYHIEWKTALKNDNSKEKQAKEVDAPVVMESQTAEQSTPALPESSAVSTSEHVATQEFVNETNTPISRTEKKRSKLANQAAAPSKDMGVNSPEVNTAEVAPITTAAPQNDQVQLSSSQLIIEVILAIFIPPLGVWLHEGSITTNFWISLILTLLFILPGSIFALLVVLDVI